MKLLTDLSNLAVANESVWVIFKLLREKINVVFLSSKGVTKKPQKNWSNSYPSEITNNIPKSLNRVIVISENKKLWLWRSASFALKTSFSVFRLKENVGEAMFSLATVLNNDDCDCHLKKKKKITFPRSVPIFCVFKTLSAHLKGVIFSFQLLLIWRWRGILSSCQNWCKTCGNWSLWRKTLLLQCFQQPSCSYETGDIFVIIVSFSASAKTTGSQGSRQNIRAGCNLVHLLPKSFLYLFWVWNRLPIRKQQTMCVVCACLCVLDCLSCTRASSELCHYR